MKTKYTEKEINNIIDRQLKRFERINRLTGLNILLRFNGKNDNIHYVVNLNVYSKQNKAKTEWIAYNSPCYDILKVKNGDYDNTKLIKSYVRFEKPIPFIKALIKKDNAKIKAKSAGVK